MNTNHPCTAPVKRVKRLFSCTLLLATCAQPLWATAPEFPEHVLFVNAQTGSVRGDGSRQKPFKDLQKAIDKAEPGTTICVAEGNYLGTLDQGFITVDKYITIRGGYNSAFTELDFTKYLTTIRPAPQQAGTSTHYSLLALNITGNATGNAVIEGLMLDRGQMSNYNAPNPAKPDSCTPVGCETGMLLPPGRGGVGGTTGGVTVERPLLSGTCEGNVTIRHCAFANGSHYAVVLGSRTGTVEISDCVFVANRMAACEVRGLTADLANNHCHFHHNTVLFSWCREKYMGDMGYGYRYMTGINSDVHHNIFACSNLAALDRSRTQNTKADEAKRETSAHHNIFFMNNADLSLPSGGGKWLFVPAARFEEVEQLKEYEGNMELPAGPMADALRAAIDPAYLNGFCNLTTSETQNYDPGSAANEIRRALGLNQRGTQTVRVSMFANRYPFSAVPRLFGAVPEYGARK